MDYQTTRKNKLKGARVFGVIGVLAALVFTSACESLSAPGSIFGPAYTPTPTIPPTPTQTPTPLPTSTPTPTPTPTPLPTPMALVASINMYKAINLYQEPNARSETVGTLEPGILVPIIEVSDDGFWLKVGLETIGWAPTSQVSLSGSIYSLPDTAPKRQGIIQSDTAVNVRSGPGLTNRVLGQIKASQVVVTLDQSDDGQWVQIPFKGGVGWVAVSTVIMAGGEPTITPVVTEEATREP